MIVSYWYMPGHHFAIKFRGVDWSSASGEVGFLLVPCWLLFPSRWNCCKSPFFVIWFVSFQGAGGGGKTLFFFL